MITQLFQHKVKQKQEVSVSDYELIDEIRAGDVNRYEELMRRYNQRLYRIARSILLDDQRAMDAVQNAHIKIYQNLTNYQGDTGFSTWVSVIARNEALMLVRKHKIDQLVTYDLDNVNNVETIEMSADQTTPSKPDDELEMLKIRKLLNAYIDGLPEKFRTAFVMRCVDELSVRETADILGINQATVKTRVFRAKAILQKRIAKQHSSSVYEIGGSHCDAIVTNVLALINNQTEAT